MATAGRRRRGVLEATRTHLCPHPHPSLPTLPAPSAADTLSPLPAQARLVLRYLRAFDAWQRVTNPRDPSTVEPARQLVAQAAAATDGSDAGLFAQCIAQLEAAGEPAEPDEFVVQLDWLQVLGNLDSVHRRNVLGERDAPPNLLAAVNRHGEGSESGGKARSMTHGVKYKLYEMRNAAGLEPLRSYWHAAGGAEAEAAQDAAGVPPTEWARLEGSEPPSLATGVMHIDDEHEDPKNATLEPKLNSLTSPWSVYVPESYSAAGSYPLILAMHGGGGRGDDYLLSWLAPARTAGAFVLSPKSIDRTWGLMSDAESRNDAISLLLMLFQLTQTYPAIDKRRILCTGMSDGGTFSYILNQVLPARVFAG